MDFIDLKTRQKDRNEQIVDYIINEIKKQNKSYSEVARAMGVSRQVLNNRLTSGIAKLTASDIIELSIILDLDLNKMKILFEQ